jgi:HPt (histidine-containing phosphotransfer) domain-containing protein
MNRSAQSGLPADAVLAQAMDRLWVKFLPEIRERVSILEQAAAAVAAETLTAAECETAQAAAHKLAGTLGTFNLMRGTVAARELEMAFSETSAPAAASGKHLASLAAELRTLIEIRKSV